MGRTFNSKGTAGAKALGGLWVGRQISQELREGQACWGGGSGDGMTQGSRQYLVPQHLTGHIKGCDLYQKSKRSHHRALSRRETCSVYILKRLLWLDFADWIEMGPERLQSVQGGGPDGSPGETMGTRMTVTADES